MQSKRWRVGGNVEVVLIVLTLKFRVEIVVARSWTLKKNKVSVLATMSSALIMEKA